MHHCDNVACTSLCVPVPTHSVEPLAADRLIDCDDAEHDGLGSNADAPTTQSRTAAHGRGRAATNSASALPTGEHRCWQVDDPDGTSGTLTVPAAGGQLCLEPGPLDQVTLTATRKRVVARVMSGSTAIGCPVATRTSTNDRHGAGGQRTYLKCAHGNQPRAPTRLEDAHPGTTLPPKLVAAAASASQDSAAWRATVAGRATGSTALQVAEPGAKACSIIEVHAGAGASAAWCSARRPLQDARHAQGGLRQRGACDVCVWTAVSAARAWK